MAAKRAARKPARKTAKTSKRKAASKPAAKKSARDMPALKRHTPTDGLWGWITHTDLASNDPDATKTWCKAVLGWTFREPFVTPDGPIHLFVYSEKGGGAVRNAHAPEQPGSIPYVHVANCKAAYDKAIAAGAQEMMAPTKVMEGVVVAIVRAPGGVPIGFSGGK